MTNQAGSVVETTTYDPWGEVLSGGTASKFLYTGQEKDSETGLHYYNARYYNSAIRHFTQPDDIIQDVYNPQSLNRYSYVGNNPLRYTDPSGHAIEGLLSFISMPAVWILGGLAATYIFATPQGQQAIKSVTALPGKVSNILQSAVSSVKTVLSNNQPAPPANSPSKSTSSTNNTPRSPQNPKVSDIIAGAAGTVAGQQIEVHGNDLRSTVTTWGYSLKERGSDVIMKFGQTINPYGRYSKQWLDANNLYMDLENSGTKAEMRIWEHEQIGNYIFQNGAAPYLNDISRSVNIYR